MSSEMIKKELRIYHQGGMITKYHVHIPEGYFASKYLEWSILTHSERNKMVEAEMEKVGKFLKSPHNVIITTFSERYPDFKIEVISPKYDTEPEPPKYHVGIPEEWLEKKYKGWGRKYWEDRQHIIQKESEKFHKSMIAQQLGALFTVLTHEYEGWEITIIEQHKAQLDILEYIGAQLHAIGEINLSKHSDLGAEILALTKNGKEAPDG